MLRAIALAPVLLAAAPAAAEIVQSTPNGFAVAHAVTVAAPPERVWPVLVSPRRWWNKEHTYSDNAANLTLDERAGGCFCETLPGGGGVEHMRVLYIQRPRALRMTGGIGPLQAEGATGTMAITLTAEGSGTKVVLSYVAGGYVRAGTDKIAPVVDRVLGIQLAGLKAAVEGGAAPAASAPPREPLAEVGDTVSDLNQPGPSPTPARPADQDSPR